MVTGMLFNEERDEITDRTIREPGMGRTDSGIDISGRDPGEFLDQSAFDVSQRLLLGDLAHRLPASIPDPRLVNQSLHEQQSRRPTRHSPNKGCRANPRRR